MATAPRSGRALAPRFGVGEANLAVRREFIRLNEEDRELLANLAPWAVSVAPAIAREFYDWQFAFGPTREFFEEFGRAKNMSMAALRPHLEAAQAEYIAAVFTGAEQGWGLAYFEHRLNVGWSTTKSICPSSGTSALTRRCSGW